MYRHELFDELRANRGIFTSRAAAEAFAGYAADQVKRMEAFDLERMAEYEDLTATIGRVGSVADVLSADSARLNYLSEAWQTPRETLTRFRALHQKYFSGYMGEKRKAMVRKYQYDVKNAAHLIRLLRMGAEFLRTGELQVYRTSDAGELMSIKRGGWTLERVKSEAERLFALIESARIESRLPPEPNATAANQLLMSHERMLALR